MSAKIECFRDLRVYVEGFKLQQEIFRMTKKFPVEEIYSLTNQIRRSSRSIGANIAESWQKRRYPAHFVSKLTDADAEQAETQHWILTSYECGYILEMTCQQLQKQCRDIGKMLGKMMQEPENGPVNSSNKKSHEIHFAFVCAVICPLSSSQ